MADRTCSSTSPPSSAPAGAASTRGRRSPTTKSATRGRARPQRPISARFDGISHGGLRPPCSFALKARPGVHRGAGAIPTPCAKEVMPPMQVFVRDNDVNGALRVLKRKMQREGVFREMKLRRHYEKPSERKAREATEAARRRDRKSP